MIEHPEILNGRLLKIPLDGMVSRKRVVSLQNPLSDDELVAETTEAEVCIARLESQIGSASGEKAIAVGCFSLASSVYRDGALFMSEGVGAVSLSAKASYADQNKYEITRRKNQDIRELVKMKVDAEISGVSLIHSEDLALLPAVEGERLAIAAKQGDKRTKAVEIFLETYGSHVCSQVVVGGVFKTKQSFQASVEVGGIVVQEAADHQFATTASAAGEFVGMNGVGKAGGSVDLKTDDSYGRQEGEANRRKMQFSDIQVDVFGGASGVSLPLWRKSLATFNANWRVTDLSVDQCTPIWHTVRGDTWGSMVQDLFQVWARRCLNLPKSIGSFDSQDRLEEQLNKELDKQRAAMKKAENCDRKGWCLPHGDATRALALAPARLARRAIAAASQTVAAAPLGKQPQARDVSKIKLRSVQAA